MTNRLLWLLLPNATIFKWFHLNSQIVQLFSMHFNYNQQLDGLQQVLRQHLFLLQLQPLHQSAMHHSMSFIWYVSTYFNTILSKINCCWSWVLWLKTTRWVQTGFFWHFNQFQGLNKLKCIKYVDLIWKQVEKMIKWLQSCRPNPWEHIFQLISTIFWYLNVI